MVGDACVKVACSVRVTLPLSSLDVVSDTVVLLLCESVGDGDDVAVAVVDVDAEWPSIVCMKDAVRVPVADWAMDPVLSVAVSEMEPL